MEEIERFWGIPNLRLIRPDGDNGVKEEGGKLGSGLLLMHKDVCDTCQGELGSRFVAEELNISYLFFCDGFVEE
jgi:hypothetical protein